MQLQSPGWKTAWQLTLFLQQVSSKRKEKQESKRETEGKSIYKIKKKRERERKGGEERGRLRDLRAIHGY